MDQLEAEAQNAAPEVSPAAEPAAAPEAGEEVPVRLTPKAVTMVKLTREQEGIDASFGLRVAVRGGGCSGFEYALDFENESRANDFVYLQGDVQLMVDPVSARYLQGTEIDYVLGSTGAGFKFNNPQAVGSCGCGSSFSV
ncbi:MAG: iron-sulfur cluster assembly accessory protein [Acidobacteria bacterium]|nr:iron-sulfur cluster assembly accessory protein [Acidobacteriota bacterium]